MASINRRRRASYKAAAVSQAGVIVDLSVSALRELADKL